MENIREFKRGILPWDYFGDVLQYYGPGSPHGSPRILRFFRKSKAHLCGKNFERASIEDGADAAGDIIVPPAAAKSIQLNLAELRDDEYTVTISRSRIYESLYPDTRSGAAGVCDNDPRPHFNDYFSMHGMSRHPLERLPPDKKVRIPLPPPDELRLSRGRGRVIAESVAHHLDLINIIIYANSRPR